MSENEWFIGCRSEIKWSGVEWEEVRNNGMEWQ